MDVLVMLEDQPGGHSPVLAHVNSVSAPMISNRPARDVVTLYGVPSAELVALALAAAVESHRTGAGHDYPNAVRHLGVWAERGALLSECGQLIRRLVAGLSMPDWPEGARRAINVSLGPVAELTAPVFAPLESLLDRLREADAMAYEYEGD